MATVVYPSQAGMTEEEKEIDRQVLQYVLKGIELLEEKYGAEWAEKIDLNTLRLTSSSKCVLGQVYGDWGQAISDLGINGRDGLYGFSEGGVPQEVRERHGGGDGYYRMLQRVWKREIRAIKS